MSTKRIVIILVLVGVSAFLGWRMVRPMNIFAVTPAFERPMDTTSKPAMFSSLSAKECATCHQDFYDEWSTSMHSKAWTDPYFQVDFEFDGSQQICLNCHIPLDNQQENRVLGFHDKAKWDPVLEPNPDFDPELQQEGVTCAACHLDGDKILGPRGGAEAPHPVKKLQNPNQICVRCHVVGGEAWDTFFRFPPCGTVAEITTTKPKMTPKPEQRGASGEMTVGEIAQLGCVGCHMPLTQRSVVKDGKVRTVRRHLWRGGHDPDMVKGALNFNLREAKAPPGQRRFSLTVTNIGAAHYLPTGTPDRHLTVSLRLLDEKGGAIDEENHILKRTLMWRPFIVDLWDTRLPQFEPRTYEIGYGTSDTNTPTHVEAVVRYFLVDEKRRLRIGYENQEATSYEVYRQRIGVAR